MKEITTEDALWRWLKKANRNERVVYYDGFLMMEKEHHYRNGGTTDTLPVPMRIAAEMWEAAMAGVVYLVQRKKDNFSYEYIAIKS